MKKIVKHCDACEKNISKDRAYFRLDLKFRTYAQDPNVNYMEEEVPNMARDTSAVYCEPCFLKFVDHMDNFLQEVSPTPVKKDPREVENDAHVAAIHSDEPDLGVEDKKRSQPETTEEKA